MACSDLYTTIAQHLKAPAAPPGNVNTASLTLTAQSPGNPDALVQTVYGFFTLNPAGDLVTSSLSGVSNNGAVTADEVTNLTRAWTVTLKADGSLTVQEGSGPPLALDETFSSTDGNCGLAPNFFVGTFTVPSGGFRLPGHPVPPPQAGVVVMSIALGSSAPIQ